MCPHRKGDWNQDGQRLVLRFLLQVRKKLQRTDSSFTCVSCNNTSVVGVLWYRMEMSIADDTDEGLFVAFDGEMKKLHNMHTYEAGHLMAGEGVNVEETQPPPFIADIVGKTYRFQVRVDMNNFTANLQTFTISRMNKRVTVCHLLTLLSTMVTMMTEKTCLGTPHPFLMLASKVTNVWKPHLQEHPPVVLPPGSLSFQQVVKKARKA